MVDRAAKRHYLIASTMNFKTSKQFECDFEDDITREVKDLAKYLIDDESS